MASDIPAILRGEARRPGGVAQPATVTLAETGFDVSVGGVTPFEAAYRDVSTVVVDREAVLLVLGTGEGAERWVFERFGPKLGALARGLRDGRLRQWLTDGLVVLAPDEPVELVEYAAGPEAGIAGLLYHRRGVALAPLDERLARHSVRRADIEAVADDPAQGGVRVDTAAGSVELRGLGAAAAAHRQRWSGLRDAAAADVSAIVTGLIPDAPFEVRRQATSVLREGHPVDAVPLGPAWGPLERAVLVEPTFAESYRALLERAGGTAAPRWLALAPEDPGAPERPKIWFLVGLPGNLVAMELVSAGAHATYLFRVAPRSTWTPGGDDTPALASAVRDVSEALIDGRFLREPMALPAARLAEAPYLRYRLALAALPSLAAARARFVARIVHRDPTSWGAALDDLVAWHGSVRDDAAEWPGRTDQESQIDEAGAGDGPPEA